MPVYSDTVYNHIFIFYVKLLPNCTDCISCYYFHLVGLEIEKHFIHPPVGEIQISQVAQNILDIYNDCILDNNTTTTNNKWLNK